MEKLMGILGAIGYLVGAMAGIKRSIQHVVVSVAWLTSYFHGKDNKELISDNMKTVMISVMQLIVFVVPIPIAYIFVQNLYTETEDFGLCLCLILATFGMGINHTKEWWEQIMSVENSELVQGKKATCKGIMPAGEDYSTELFDKLCENVGLNGVSLWEIDEKRIGARAVVKKMPLKRGMIRKTMKVTMIQITTGALLLPREELSALLAHELMHIVNGDNGGMEIFRQIIASGIAILGVQVICLIFELVAKIPVVGELLSFGVIIFSLIYMLVVLFLVTIGDRYVWEQIKEIRADRMACEVEGVTREGMVRLLRRLQKEPKTKMDWIDKIHFNYYVVEEHPCLEHRIFLIENYKKWSVLDYYKHVFQVFKWVFTGKGWRGEIRSKG